MLRSGATHPIHPCFPARGAPPSMLGYPLETCTRVVQRERPFQRKRVSAAALTLLALVAAAGAGAQSVTFERLGGRAADEFGAAVAGVGDIDGDGVADLVIGARRDSQGDPQSGRVFVVSGVDGATIREHNGSFASFFGHAVAAVGDADGDGVGDYVIGSPSAAPNGLTSGLAEVFSGRTGMRLHRLPGLTPGERAGHAVAGVGDVDGDGYDDVAVGAPLADGVAGLDAGSVRVHSGRTGALLHTVFGDATRALLGWSVAGVGDIDGDGRDDWVVGILRDATGGPAAGAARVYSGATASVLHTKHGTAGAWFGAAVSGGVDVDADGTPDWAVGAPEDSLLGPRAGSVRVYSGADGSEIFALTDAADADSFGSSVALLDDVDGDGHGDVLVGAPLALLTGDRVGAAVLFGGVSGAPLHHFWGTQIDARCGWSVASCGDPDADGFAEFIVGAPTDRAAGSAVLLDYDAIGTPPRQSVFGTACVGGLDHLPRIGWRGATRIGTTVDITLRGVSPTADPIVSFLVGDPGPSLPLDAIGSTGCFLHVNPYALVQTPMTPHRTAHFGLRFPLDANMIGIAFECQWVVADPGAPYSLGLAFSAGLEVVVGN